MASIDDAFADLSTAGWAIVKGISSQAALLELSQTLGHIVPSPNGELIKEIRVAPKASATPGSQSARHGTGILPLHTDTIFWPNPARYIVLRGVGDTRRPTIVLPFSEVFAQLDERTASLVKHSVWTVGVGSHPFYCSLQFRSHDGYGWRYDCDLMSPANAAAMEVNAVLRPLVASGIGRSIHWSGDTAVILSNWHVLHGRGPEPSDEGARVIERIYIR